MGWEAPYWVYICMYIYMCVYMGIKYGNGKSSDDVPWFSRSGIPSHDGLRVVLIGDPIQLIPMTQVRGHCRNQPFWGKDVGHFWEIKPEYLAKRLTFRGSKNGFFMGRIQGSQKFCERFLKRFVPGAPWWCDEDANSPSPKGLLLLYPKNHLGAVLDSDLGRSDTNINQYSSRQ